MIMRKNVKKIFVIFFFDNICKSIDTNILEIGKPQTREKCTETIGSRLLHVILYNYKYIVIRFCYHYSYVKYLNICNRNALFRKISIKK